MPYLQPQAPGFAYGLGTLQGSGQAGQVVRLVGPDLFAVNTQPSARAFGVLYKPAVDGERCAVYCCGGIYETDQVAGTPGAGDRLACDADTGKLRPAADGEFEVAETISLSGGVLRFKLLV